MANDRSQARCEAAILLGVDIERLSPADSLRVDMVSALRLVIDSEQAGILSGGSADLGKLNVAVQSLIALLPNRELPESASSRPDPREIMWQTYKQMRDRGAQFGLGYDGLKLTVERLQAKIAELEAAAAPALPSSVPPVPAGNVVTLSRPANERTSERSEVSPNSPPVLGNLVCDPSREEPWKSYVEPDGSIRATPFDGGKYWGPV